MPYENTISIAARMSKDSFKKMSDAFSEVCNGNPTSQLAKNIYKYLRENADQAEYFQEAYYSLTDDNIIPNPQEQKFVDFEIKFVGDPNFIKYQMLKFALEQDNNYDLVIVNNNDGSITKEACYTGTFKKSPLFKRVLNNRAEAIYHRIAYITAEYQLSSGKDDTAAFTKSSQKYLKLASEFRKIHDISPDCIPNEERGKTLWELGKTHAKVNVCTENNIPCCYSFAQVKGLMASRRETQPKSMQR